MEFESGQSGSRAMLFITSPWSAREKYKDPTVLSHFLPHSPELFFHL